MAIWFLQDTLGPQNCGTKPLLRSDWHKPTEILAKQKARKRAIGRKVGERLAAPSGWPFHHSREPGLVGPGSPSPVPPVARDILPECDQEHGGCREHQDGGADLSDAGGGERAGRQFCKDGRSALMRHPKEVRRWIGGFGKGVVPVIVGRTTPKSAKPRTRGTLQNTVNGGLGR